ncbi:circumsporozoite protein-like [Agelaius tricolor]|uniref:circumsporozoite protein-like n=1 Tax=Agelaius tricolor TaxID=9191 RepID=UPI0039F2461F
MERPSPPGLARLCRPLPGARQPAAARGATYPPRSAGRPGPIGGERGLLRPPPPLPPPPQPAVLSHAEAGARRRGGAAPTCGNLAAGQMPPSTAGCWEERGGERRPRLPFASARGRKPRFTSGAAARPSQRAAAPQRGPPAEEEEEGEGSSPGPAARQRQQRKVLLGLATGCFFNT